MTIAVIIVLLLIIVIILISHFRLVKQYKEDFEKECDQKIKMTEFYDILICWIGLYQKGKKFSKWMAEKGYDRIAVYGMKELGELVYYELLQEHLDVRCAIDKNAGSLNLKKIEVLKPTEELPDMDVIIVTAPHYFDQIRNELEGITKADIVSIEDIIFAI